MLPELLVVPRCAQPVRGSTSSLHKHQRGIDCARPTPTHQSSPCRRMIMSPTRLQVRRRPITVRRKASRAAAPRTYFLLSPQPAALHGPGATSPSSPFIYFVDNQGPLQGLSSEAARRGYGAFPSARNAIYGDGFKPLLRGARGARSRRSKLKPLDQKPARLLRCTKSCSPCGRNSFTTGRTRGARFGYDNPVLLALGEPAAAALAGLRTGPASHARSRCSLRTRPAVEAAVLVLGVGVRRPRAFRPSDGTGRGRFRAAARRCAEEGPKGDARP